MKTQIAKFIAILTVVTTVTSLAFAKSNLAGQGEKEIYKWSSDILLKTCPQELQAALDFVLENLEKQNKAKYIAILPEKIEYQYFTMEFRQVKNSLAIPSKSFEYEFEYWVEGENEDDQICTRVDPLDYSY